MTETIKDPVCGMTVRAEEGLSLSHGNQSFHFCSQLCMRSFRAHPEEYGGLSPVETDSRPRRIAYFTMEVAIDSRMPTYSGGLGVLAGDALQSYADLRIPVVGVSLLYRQGYFDQKLDQWGNQRELAVEWDPSAYARLLPSTVKVTIERSRLLAAMELGVVAALQPQIGLKIKSPAALR